MRSFGYLLFFFFLPLSLLGQNTDQILLANQYFELGDYEKSKTIFKKLARHKNNLPFIHENYFKLLVTIQEYDEAEKYIKYALKQDPDNFIYGIDHGLLFKSQKDEIRSSKIFDDLIEKVVHHAKENKNVNEIRLLAQTLFDKDLREIALKTFLEGRKVMKRPELFALELANAYRLMNQKQLMVREYLMFSKSQPHNISYVKNSFQRILTEPEDLDSLEIVLYGYIQEEADPIYNDMLVWTHLQQKNFPAALRQARALDLRLRKNGGNILNVGLIAFKNKDYKTARKAFSDVVDDFPKSPNQTLAKKHFLQSEEEVIKSTYPVDQKAIKTLIDKYEVFKASSKDIFTSLDAERRIALLNAFYLDEKQEAIKILNQVAKRKVGKHPVIGRAKMDLADIYLLNEEPWESILLYAQVEKMFKDEPLGYQAKLKSAKLSYFKGEFELAQGHLDILKLATSREIANDALELSILIKNNTVFDSTDLVMQAFANIELMLFQNQKAEALDRLDEMLSKHPNHSIADEVYYLKSKVLRELGRAEEAIETLDHINQKYYFEILGDDALFLTGLIYEEDLKDSEKAMEAYTELLKKFPGSIYVAESRKRYRELRGDF